jgi:hypothetical protein
VSLKNTCKFKEGDVVLVDWNRTTDSEWDSFRGAFLKDYPLSVATVHEESKHGFCVLGKVRRLYVVSEDLLVKI